MNVFGVDKSVAKSVPAGTVKIQNLEKLPLSRSTKAVNAKSQDAPRNTASVIKMVENVDPIAIAQTAAMENEINNTVLNESSFSIFFTSFIL